MPNILKDRAARRAAYPGQATRTQGTTADGSARYNIGNEKIDEKYLVLPGRLDVWVIPSSEMSKIPQGGEGQGGFIKRSQAYAGDPDNGRDWANSIQSANLSVLRSVSVKINPDPAQKTVPWAPFSVFDDGEIRRMILDNGTILHSKFTPLVKEGEQQPTIEDVRDSRTLFIQGSVLWAETGEVYNVYATLTFNVRSTVNLGTKVIGAKADAEVSAAAAEAVKPPVA